jgi:hypothetical protein
MKRAVHVLLLAVLIQGVTVNRARGQSSDSPISISGDLRYRHEMIDAENRDQRNRERIRARLSISATVNSDMTVGMRIASGTDDPISTNQNLDDGFSSKDIRLDRAFFTWAPSSLSGLAVTGGKVANPFFSPGKTELIWDSDLSPEGVAISVTRSMGAVAVDLSASGFWVDERSSGNDGILLGSQAVAHVDASAADVAVGAGYFDYQNTRNMPTFHDAADSFGNSVNAAGNYRHDYNELELLCSVAPKGVPGNISVFADYVTNIAHDVKDNTAWLVGFSAGKMQETGSCRMRYSYRSIERDAVIAAFTDSDFLGGGTDGNGHEINVDWQAAEKAVFGATYYNNMAGLDNGTEYHRVMFDLIVKF